MIKPHGSQKERAEENLMSGIGRVPSSPTPTTPDDHTSSATPSTSTGRGPGSWIADGSSGESSFEGATGIDISGDRRIDNAAYKLMREAGAPSDAQFGLRDASGKQLATKAGDKVVPTVIENGKM